MVTLNLFGSAQRQQREQEAHNYVLSYVQLHLAAPMARTVLLDHPATRAAFPAVVSIFTVGTLMATKRHKGRPAAVVGAAFIGVATGSVTYYWQQRLAHTALLQQLEHVVIPHMRNMHVQCSGQVQSYGEFLKLMEERAAVERRLLGVDSKGARQE